MKEQIGSLIIVFYRHTVNPIPKSKKAPTSVGTETRESHKSIPACFSFNFLCIRKITERELAINTNVLDMSIELPSGIIVVPRTIARLFLKPVPSRRRIPTLNPISIILATHKHLLNFRNNKKPPQRGGAISQEYMKQN